PALIPSITVMGMQIAMMLGGAVLTETTCEWRGLGFELVRYLGARDFVAVQGIVALLAVIVAITNFIVDVVATLIDPRVRYWDDRGLCDPAPRGTGGGPDRTGVGPGTGAASAAVVRGPATGHAGGRPGAVPAVRADGTARAAGRALPVQPARRRRRHLRPPSTPG